MRSASWAALATASAWISVQLGVEIGQLGDLVVVDRLDRVDLGGHVLDVGLHGGQVGVDPGQLRRRGVDDDAEVRLQPVELGDLALLGGDLGLQRLLPGERVRKLVAGGDRRRSERPAQQRDEQARTRPKRTVVPSRRRRARTGSGERVRGRPAFGVGRSRWRRHAASKLRCARLTTRLAATPAGTRRPLGATPLDDSRLRGIIPRSSSTPVRRAAGG